MRFSDMDDAFPRMTWSITLGIGIVLVTVGVFLGIREHYWLRGATVVPGRVIGLIESQDNKGTLSYAPQVQYTSKDGAQRQFDGNTFSHPPQFQVGEPVTVAYDSDSYEGRILTFGQRFGLAVALAVVGLGCVTMALAFMVGNQIVPRIYLN